MDDQKVSTIKQWPSPKNVVEVQSFHGLATFYRRFIKGFSSIMTLITNCLKQGQFRWEVEQEQSFQEINNKLFSALVLVLPDFSRPFEEETDASMLGVGDVLTQVGCPI